MTNKNELDELKTWERRVSIAVQVPLMLGVLSVCFGGGFMIGSFTRLILALL